MLRFDLLRMQIQNDGGMSCRRPPDRSVRENAGVWHSTSFIGQSQGSEILGAARQQQSRRSAVQLMLPICKPTMEQTSKRVVQNYNINTNKNINLARRILNNGESIV